jgi:hypothetical protein
VLIKQAQSQKSGDGQLLPTLHSSFAASTDNIKLGIIQGRNHLLSLNKSETQVHNDSVLSYYPQSWQKAGQ